MSTVDISQDPLPSLFKDGISEDLFRLLWAKDELNFGPSINIPDTIIYRHGQPMSWYFTALNGRVKRKNRQNLLSEKIEEIFNKNVLGYDVLAYFISVPGEIELQVDLSSQITIEYFDRDALNDFLYKRKKVMNGMLQRFIEPKTTKNEVIRAIWSPKVCLLERAENIHQLHDKRYGLYEKCVIYEGPEYYFTSAPLRGPVLSGQIQKLCESIVSHVSEVTYGQKQLSRIVLNFKVDSRDKIWLLYSTSIRCVDMLEFSTNPNDPSRLERTLVNIDSVISLSPDVHLNPSMSYSKIVPKSKVRCLSCTRETLEDMRHPVTYKTVIKHYEHVLYLLADAPAPRALGASHDTYSESMVEWPPDAEMVETSGGVGFGCLFLKEDTEELLQVPINPRPRHLRDLQIPPIISHLHPRLNTKSYIRCKNDPLFLYKTVNVCETCYLVYAEFTSMLLQMGQDLRKLLTPDPVAVAHLEMQSSAARPSSADWRAISLADIRGHTRNSSSSVHGAYVSAQHAEAKERAIGLRSSDQRQQPEIPRAVRHASDAALGLGSGSSGAYGQSSTYEPDDIQAVIAERERRFFKEISLNPQLKDQHPLIHLISAQEKLKLIDQQSGVLMSSAANKQESVFGTKYGKQKGDKFKPFSSYGVELPYAIGGELVLPSQLPKLRKVAHQKKLARQRRLELELGAASSASKSPKSLKKSSSYGATGMQQTSSVSVSDTLNSGSTRTFGAPSPDGHAQEPPMSSADQHKEFLKNALKTVQHEVESAEPYRRAGTGAGTGTGTGTGGRNAMAAADARTGSRGKGSAGSAGGTRTPGMPKKETRIAGAPSFPHNGSSVSSSDHAQDQDQENDHDMSLSQSYTGGSAEAASASDSAPRVGSPGGGRGGSGSADDGSLGTESTANMTTESSMLRRIGVNPGSADPQANASKENRQRIREESHELLNG